MKKAVCMLTFVLLAGLGSGLAQETITGEWTAKFRNTRLWLKLQKESDWRRGSSYSESIALADIKGLDAAASTGESVQATFEYPRDAGTFFTVK